MTTKTGSRSSENALFFFHLLGQFGGKFFFLLKKTFSSRTLLKLIERNAITDGDLMERLTSTSRFSDSYTNSITCPDRV